MEVKSTRSVHRSNADQILKEAFEKEEENLLLEKVEKVLSPEEKSVRHAYEKKIKWYQDKIDKLTIESTEMIKQCNNDPTYNLEKFMTRAEKIGIDIMNHQTIIDMFIKQFTQWFEDTPEVVKDRYIDIEILKYCN